MPQKTYTLLQKICKQHKVFPKQVLELMCGEGEVLKLFAEKSKIYGIEKDDELFQKLKQSLTEGKFYNQSLSSFRIPFRWQLIYCLDTSFNQLTKYSDWEKVFQKARGHLEPYGLFVFRINTDKYYVGLWDKLDIAQSEKDYLITQTKKSKQGVYQTSIKRFVYKNDDTYMLSQSSSSETMFPLTQVKKTLQQCFENISIVDLKWRKAKPQASEVYVICQKGRE